MADFNHPGTCYSTHQFNIATFQYPFKAIRMACPLQAMRT